MSDVFTDEQINEILNIFRQNIGHRKYVGARYVPIFGRKDEESIEWDNSAPYEPLTIVLHQGNSFTSRQYVPTGVDISNNDFWAETGTYNAQIEQYRNEVRNFDARIETNTEDIAAETEARELAIAAETEARELAINDIILKPNKNEMNIEILNGAEHTITLVNDMKDTFIAIDCAGAADKSAVEDYLFSRLGNDKKLAAVIITHFHSDHWGGFEAVAKYCDTNTDIWIQMSPTVANDEFTDTYVPAYNSVVNIATMYGLQNNIHVPANLSTRQYGDMTLDFYNTADAYKEIYDTSWGQDNWANPATRKSTLNNYSLVVRFTAYGATYLETGDIEGAAQKVLAAYMQPVTVAKHPHHLWNRMGFELFYDRVQPQYWLATDHFRSASEGYLLDSRFDTTYLFRYLLYNQSDVNIVTNDQTNVVCKISHNTVTDIRGYFVDKDYSRVFIDVDNPTERANQVLFDAIIPPSVYYDNPYQVRLLTADDLWTLKTNMRGCPYFEFRVTPAMGSADAPYQIREDLARLFAPSVNTGNYYITLREFPTIYVDSQWRNGTYIQLMYSFTMENLPMNMRRFSNGAVPLKITGTYANGDTISGDEWSAIRNAKILSCENTDTTRRIPLINVRNDTSAGSSGAYGDFSGMVISTGGEYIYAVKIDSNGLVHTDKVKLSDGTVTHFNITGITPIY